jgi:hypothetical protein
MEGMEVDSAALPTRHGTPPGSQKIERFTSPTLESINLANRIIDTDVTVRKVELHLDVAQCLDPN